MATGYSLYSNRPDVEKDLEYRQPGESFTARQARLGATPKPATNQPLYSQTPKPEQPQPKQYGGYSPNANIALAGLQQQFRNSKWNTAKRGMTAEEQKALVDYAGYKTGDVSQDQWNKANFGVENYTGDLKNPGIPAYNQAAPQAAQPGTAGPRLPNAAGFQGTPGYGVATPSAYTPDTASAPGTYNPFQFSQWTGVDDGPTGDRMQEILNQVLASPEVLDEQTINQMKMRSKDSALAQNEQLLSQFGSDVASRGFAGGGMEAAGKIAAGQDLISTLINQNRDIDIASKEKNRASTLEAVSAGDAFLNSRLGRASENFGNALEGQGRQAGENQFGAGYDLDRFKTLEEGARAANDSEFRNAEFTYGQVKDDRDSRLQEFLAEEGVSLDRDKFSELKNQFKAATGLDLMKFLESKRQFDATLNEDSRQFNSAQGEGARQFNTSAGIDTARLNLQGQGMLQQFIDSIYSGGGR